MKNRLGKIKEKSYVRGLRHMHLLQTMDHGHPYIYSVLKEQISQKNARKKIKLFRSGLNYLFLKKKTTTTTTNKQTQFKHISQITELKVTHSLALNYRGFHSRTRTMNVPMGTGLVVNFFTQ